MLRRLVLSTAALLAAAAAAPALAADPPAAPWQSPLLQDHPLVGTFVEASTGVTLSAEDVLSRATDARYLILGERHDNPDHHDLQAWATEQVVERGRRPAIVYEMFEADEQDEIDAFLAGGPADAAGLGEAVDWAESGWPAWEHYRPMADTAVAHGLPVLAGNLARDTIRDIARQGLDTLPDDQVNRLGLLEPDTPAILAAMTRDVDEGHCNLMPEEAIAPMVTVQRARDARMAAAMIQGLEAEGTDQAILITGNGHARTDRGVPLRLRQMDIAAGDVLVIAPMEVREGMTKVADYAKAWGGESRNAPFDILYFTPRLDMVDHCEELRARMEKKKAE
ncbi:ChaN family lipoprotein [Caenispirillum salinarum]|uniref:ChaN family lipoprotein n=1 Tax=Caenispirillum salinarum TaxID=859058 RepID=UPI00384A7077